MAIHNYKALADYLGVIIIVLIIIIAIIPLYFFFTTITSQSNKPTNLAQIVSQQISGGGILIYYNSTQNPIIFINPPNANYTLLQVYYQYRGLWVNITSSVTALGNSNVKLPAQLKYNFSLPNTAFNNPLLLVVKAYNVTKFVYLLPNASAITT
jgi:hypothetical protein